MKPQPCSNTRASDPNASASLSCASSSDASSACSTRSRTHTGALQPLSHAAAAMLSLCRPASALHPSSRRASALQSPLRLCPLLLSLSLCVLLAGVLSVRPVLALATMGFSSITFTSCYPGQRFGVVVTPPGPVGNDVTFTPTSSNPSVAVACDPTYGCPSWTASDATSRHFSVVVSASAFVAGNTASFDLGGSFGGPGAPLFNPVTPTTYTLQVVAPPVALSQHGGGARNVYGSFDYQQGGVRVGNSLTDKITFGHVWGLAAISCCGYPTIFSADNDAGAITRIRKNATQYGDDVDQPWSISAPRWAAAHCDTSGGCASRTAVLYVGDNNCKIWKIDVYAEPVTAPVLWLGQLGCGLGTFQPGSGLTDVTTQQLPNEVDKAAISPDGAWLALNSNDHLYLVNTTSGLISPVLPGTSTWGVVALTDTHLYYWSSGPKQVRRLLLSDQVTDELILSLGNDVNSLVVDSARGRVLFSYLNYIAMHLLTDSTSTFSILAGHTHTAAEEADGADTDTYGVSGWMDGAGTKSVLGSPGNLVFNDADNEVYFSTAIANDVYYTDETQGLRKLSGGDFSSAAYPVAAEVSPLVPQYGVCSYLVGRSYGFGRSWTSIGMTDWLVPLAGVAGRPPVLYTSEHIGQTAVKRINKINLDTSEYTQNTWADSAFRSSTRFDPLNTARAASQTLFSIDTFHSSVPQINSYDQLTNTNVRYTNNARNGQAFPSTPRRAQFDDSTDTLIWFESSINGNVNCSFVAIPYADFLIVNRTAERVIASIDTCDSDLTNPFYLFEADFAIDQVHQKIYSVKTMWAGGAVFRTPRILMIDIATGNMTNLFTTDWSTLENPASSFDAMLDDGAEGFGATIWQPDRIAIPASGGKAYVTDGGDASWRVIREIDLLASPRTIRTIYGSRSNIGNYLTCLDGAGSFGGLNMRTGLAFDPRDNGLLYVGLKNKVRTLAVGSTLPVVSEVLPEKVTVGSTATVTITGANFDSGFTALWWNDLSQVPVARVACAAASWVSSTSMVCTNHQFTSYGNWVPSIVQPSGESQLYGVFVEVAPLGSITSVSSPYVLSGGAQIVLLNHTGSQPTVLGGVQYYSISGTTVAATACTNVARVTTSQLSCTVNNLPVLAVIQYRVLDGSGNSVMSIASGVSSTGYNQTYFTYTYPTSVHPGAVWGAFVDPSSNVVKVPTHLRFTPSLNLSGVIYAPFGPGTTYIDFDNSVTPKRMAIRFPSSTTSGRYTASATVADDTNTNSDALLYKPPPTQTFDLTALRVPDSLSIHGGNIGLGNGLHPDGLDGTAGVSDISWGTVGGAALGGVRNDSVFSIDLRTWDPLSATRQFRLFNRTSGVMKGWTQSGLFGNPSFWAVSPLAPNTVLVGTSTCRLQKLVFNGASVAITSPFTGSCLTGVFKDNSWSGGAIHAADPNRIFVIQFGMVFSAHITTLALQQWTGSIATNGPLATAAETVYFFSNGQVIALDLTTNTTQAIAGQAGVVDHLDGGFGSNAFDTPMAFAVNAANTVLYVSTSCAIRRVDLITKIVTTLAGAFHRPDSFDLASYPLCGILEGVGPAARLSQPWPLMLDESSNRILFSEVSSLFKVRVGMRQLDLATNAVTNLVSNNPSCSFPEGSVDGVGSAWSSSGPTNIRFLPSTSSRSPQIFGEEVAGLLGARRNFFAVDLVSGRKSASRPFSITFFSNIAAAAGSTAFVGLVTIANTDVYFFSSYGTLYSADSTGVEVTMPTPLFQVRSVRYDPATAKLVLYQQNTAAALSQANCSFWQIPYSSYVVGGITAQAAWQSVAVDATCAAGGITASVVGNEWIYESEFVVSSTGSIAYSIPAQTGRTRIRVVNLVTGALSNLFYTDWPSMGSTYNNFVNTATWWLSDGYSEAGATMGSATSIAIDSTNSFLYIADAPNGVSSTAVRAINTIRKIDIANKRIDTLAGKYPWTTYRDLCLNANPANTQLFRPVNSQAIGAFNSIALDTRNDGVLYVISGTRIRTITVLNLPLITAIAPATALLGASTSTITLFGVNFGSSAGQLTDIKFGASLGTEMSGVAPTWVSATQISVTIPAGLRTGAYVFTIKTTSGARGIPSAPFVYTVGGLAGSLTTVTPSAAYAGQNVTLNSTSFGPNVATVSFFGTVLGQPARFNCSSIALRTPTSLLCTLPMSLATVANGTVFTFQAFSATDIPLQNATASPTLTLVMAPVSSSGAAQSSSAAAQSSSGVAASSSAADIVFASSSTGPVSDVVVAVVVSPTDATYYNEQTAAADNAALKPQATATTVVTESGVVLNVTTAAGVDINPCHTDANPCLYGSACVFTPFVNNTVTGIVTNASLTCTCLDGFFGPQCNIAVLKCHNCVSSLSGGSNITLLGLNLDYITGMRIAGSVVPFSRGYVDRSSTTALGAVARAALNLPWPDSVRSLTVLSFMAFVAPSTIVVSADGNSTYSWADLHGSSAGRAPGSTGMGTGEAPSSTAMPARRLLAVDESGVNTTITTSHVSSDISIVLPNRFKFAYTLNSLIYYTKSSCILEGQWKEDGSGGCLACPTGACCPGGDRAWPTSQYWSYSENASPQKCPLASQGACPGVVCDSAFASQKISTGAKNTQICEVGYTGVACSLCDTGYFMSESRCWSCGSTSSQQAYFSLMLLVGFGIVCGLALAVAVLKAKMLAQTVTFFMILQQAVQVGKSGSSSLPESTQFIAEFFNSASIINFDVEFVKPGCTGPAITFMQLFWFTVLLAVVTGIMFFLACLLRRMFNSKRASRQEALERAKSLERVRSMANLRKTSGHVEADRIALERLATEARLEEERKAKELASKMFVPPRVDFYRRLVHSFLILLSLYYLKLTTLCVRGVICSYSPDPSPLDGSYTVTTESLYLEVDKSIRCYQGYHLATVVFIFFFFIFYCVGFPVFCFVVLTRAFITPEHGGIMGWLVRHFKVFQSRSQQLSDKKARALKRQLTLEASESAKATAVARQISSPMPNASGASVWDVDSSAAAVINAKANAKRAALEQQLVKHAILQRTRMDMFGYLYMQLKEDYPLFRLFTSFPVSMIYALSTNLTDDTQIQLFVLGLVSCCAFMAVLVQQPFVSRFDNRKMALIYSASLAHVVITMGATYESARDGSRKYFYILIGLWCVLTLWIFIRKCCGCLARLIDTDDDRFAAGDGAGEVEVFGAGEDEIELAPLPQDKQKHLTAMVLPADDAVTPVLVVPASPSPIDPRNMRIQIDKQASRASAAAAAASAGAASGGRMPMSLDESEDPDGAVHTMHLKISPQGDPSSLASPSGAADSNVLPVSPSDGVGMHSSPGAHTLGPRSNSQPGGGGRSSHRASPQLGARTFSDDGRAAPSQVSINGESHIVASRHMPGPLRISPSPGRMLLAPQDPQEGHCSLPGSQDVSPHLTPKDGGTPSNGESGSEAPVRFHVRANSDSVAPAPEPQQPLSAGRTLDASDRVRRGSHSAVRLSPLPNGSNSSRRGSRVYQLPLASSSAASESMHKYAPATSNIITPASNSRRNSAQGDAMGITPVGMVGARPGSAAGSRRGSGEAMALAGGVSPSLPPRTVVRGARLSGINLLTVSGPAPAVAALSSSPSASSAASAAAPGAETAAAAASAEPPASVTSPVEVFTPSPNSRPPSREAERAQE